MSHPTAPTRPDVEPLESLAARARAGDRRALAALDARSAAEVTDLALALVHDRRGVRRLVRAAVREAVADSSRPYGISLVQAVSASAAHLRRTRSEGWRSRLRRRRPDVPRRVQAVAVLCDGQGHSHASAAALLGLPVAEVAALHAEARRGAGLAGPRTTCRGWPLVTRDDLTWPEQQAAAAHLVLCRTCTEALDARTAARTRLGAAVPVGTGIVGGSVLAGGLMTTLGSVGSTVVSTVGAGATVVGAAGAGVALVAVGALSLPAAGLAGPPAPAPAQARPVQARPGALTTPAAVRGPRPSPAQPARAGGPRPPSPATARAASPAPGRPSPHPAAAGTPSALPLPVPPPAAALPLPSATPPVGGVPRRPAAPGLPGPALPAPALPAPVLPAPALPAPGGPAPPRPAPPPVQVPPVAGPAAHVGVPVGLPVGVTVGLPVGVTVGMTVGLPVGGPETLTARVPATAPRGQAVLPG